MLSSRGSNLREFLSSLFARPRPDPANLPRIDRYVDLLAEEFNKVSSDASSTDPAIPIVHNTCSSLRISPLQAAAADATRTDQCYLRTTPPAMAASIARAEEKGYSWGAKLVRGAYVESERKRWSAAGSKGDCIVWNNKAETDECVLLPLSFPLAGTDLLRFADATIPAPSSSRNESPTNSSRASLAPLEQAPSTRATTERAR